MSKKNKADQRGFVFSTDPNFSFEEETGETETLPPDKQRLLLRLDTKQRAGKAVTLVERFVGTTPDLEELGKKLKSHCGTGGSVKDGLILIQGDHRQKLKGYLQSLGYKLTN
ncbi:MAG: translation initiation factor [Bacteroidetes bacterium]|nr:translation initiation factor [Bacteroidota bacterium]